MNTGKMTMPDDLSALTTTQKIGLGIVNQVGAIQAKLHEIFVDEPVWRSADGRVTPISKMDQFHLQNSMKMMGRNGNTGYKFQQLLDEFISRMPKEKQEIPGVREKITTLCKHNKNPWPKGPPQNSRSPNSEKSRKRGRSEIYRQICNQAFDGKSSPDIMDLDTCKTLAFAKARGIEAGLGVKLTEKDIEKASQQAYNRIVRDIKESR